MSNRSSCRILRFLGMDGFLGFKCGPSCSEKQHNKDIKALIDAIDDLLAYDSKTKKELGATDPGIDVSLMARGLTGKLDDINNKAYVLLGKHIPDPFESSDQPRMVTCDKNLRGLVVTVDSINSILCCDFMLWPWPWPCTWAMAIGHGHGAKVGSGNRFDRFDFAIDSIDLRGEGLGGQPW